MGLFDSRTFCAVGRLVMEPLVMGTFLEWDVSRAGPFVCAPLKRCAKTQKRNVA
jgi:hypothetical protein